MRISCARTCLLALVALLGCGIMQDPVSVSARADDFHAGDGGGSLSAAEAGLSQAINAARRKANLRALVPNEDVMLVAQSHARNMAAQSNLSHELDGERAGDRLDRVGYEYLRWAENIASGYQTPAAAVKGWMTSGEGHREHILNAKMVHIGVGVATSAKGTRYYCAVFAVPR